MRCGSVLFLLAAACFSFCACSSGGGETQTAGRQEREEAEQQIRELEQQWADAELRRDAAFFQRVMADEYIYTTPDSVAMSKSQMIADSKPLPDGITGVSTTLDDTKISSYGNTAVVTGAVTQKLQAQGKSITGKYRYTKVYVKQDGSWRAVAMQSAIAGPR